MRSRVRC
jgi:ribonuclease HI